MHDIPYVPEPVIGRSVRAAIAAQDRSESDLAEVLGLSLNSVRRRLRGLTSWDAHELYRAASWLGLTTHDLISGRAIASLMPQSVVGDELSARPD